MKALKSKSKALLGGSFLVAFILVGFASSAQEQPGRFDLYDAQGNKLMFIVYEYDQNGTNTAYTVYFSDTTFTRRVVIGRNASGVRETETAYSFNEDTAYTTKYAVSGNTTTMTVLDQFKVDQFHAPYTYTKTDPLKYHFSQKNSTYEYDMEYEYDGNGNMTKVNLYDKNHVPIYYGVPSSISGILPTQNKLYATRSSINLKGDNVLAWEFILDRESKVKCEVMSLLGRRIAVLYSGILPEGSHSRILRLGRVASLTNGVYVAVMSIDNEPVVNTKFTVQRIRGGVK